MKVINDNAKVISFKGMMNSKTVLKGLETVSNHGASFVAGTSFLMSTVVRPLSIAVTPNVKKENKEHAIVNSIASGGVKFLFVEAIALPVEQAIKKIEKKPDDFLKKETVDRLNQSKNFKFIAQLIKQGVGFITAVPKSMLTVALIPVLMGKIFKENNNKQQNAVFSPSFKGGFTDLAAKATGKIFDNKLIQNISEKYNKYEANITRDMSMATDVLLSASFTHQTMKNKKIDENRKKPLVLNNIYGTIATLLGGFSLDKLIKKNTHKFIEKFSEINKNDPKLKKYIEGINIIRPTLIFAGIYYGILPILTTYLADKSDKTQ